MFLGTAMNVIEKDCEFSWVERGGKEYFKESRAR